jgi:hypothetical protein
MANNAITRPDATIVEYGSKIKVHAINQTNRAKCKKMNAIELMQLYRREEERKRKAPMLSDTCTCLLSCKAPVRPISAYQSGGRLASGMDGKRKNNHVNIHAGARTDSGPAAILLVPRGKKLERFKGGSRPLVTGVRETRTINNG